MDSVSSGHPLQGDLAVLIISDCTYMDIKNRMKSIGGGNVMTSLGKDREEEETWYAAKAK